MIHAEDRADKAARLAELERRFDSQRCLLRSGTGTQHALAQGTLEYAILLFDRDHPGDAARGVSIVKAMLDEQLHAPSWDAGRFPFHVPEVWRDLNANLFLATDLTDVATRWRHKLPDDLAVRLRGAVIEAAKLATRRWADELFDVHRDFVRYSNIFVLYIHALYVYGSRMELPELLHDAPHQWRRWFNHVSQHGVDEFTSSTYNEVVYHALVDIHALTADDAAVQREVALVLDHLTILQQAVNHPLLRVQAVGVSRDYRRFVQPGAGAFAYLDFEGACGYLPTRTGVDGWRKRVFPYRVAGRAGTQPFLFKSWQVEKACLGTMTGGHYFWQQLHVMAAVGDSPAARACAFMNADGGNVLQGFTKQEDGRALALFSRTASPYHWYQLRQVEKPDVHVMSPEAKAGERAQPPTLGLTQGWRVACPEAGYLTATAYGHTLHVRGYSLRGGRVEPMALVARQVEIEGGKKLDAWEAESDSLWTAFLVELLPEGQQPSAARLEAKVAQDGVTLSEAGGLSVRLHIRPNGELVELHEQDWRTLPLLETPEHTLHAGDLIQASHMGRRL